MRNQSVTAASTMLFSFVVAAGMVSVAMAPENQDSLPVGTASSHEREFDFWLGEWDVQNRHLRSGSWKNTSSPTQSPPAIPAAQRS